MTGWPEPGALVGGELVEARLKTSSSAAAACRAHLLDGDRSVELAARGS